MISHRREAWPPFFFVLNILRNDGLPNDKALGKGGLIYPFHNHRDALTAADAQRGQTERFIVR